MLYLDVLAGDWKGFGAHFSEVRNSRGDNDNKKTTRIYVRRLNGPSRFSFPCKPCKHINNAHPPTPTNTHTHTCKYLKPADGIRMRVSTVAHNTGGSEGPAGANRSHRKHTTNEYVCSHTCVTHLSAIILHTYTHTLLLLLLTVTCATVRASAHVRPCVRSGLPCASISVCAAPALVRCRHPGL